MTSNNKNISIIFILEIILKTKQTYYISFEVFRVDDCVTKIYKNNNTSEILYKKPSENGCDYKTVPKNPVLFQYDLIFGNEFYFEIRDDGGYISLLGVNVRINEYLIQPKLQNFWKCNNCRTGDGNYI